MAEPPATPVPTPTNSVSFESDSFAATAGVGPNLGQYQLLTCLGSGGMGEVYRALHIRLKRQVAIKLLHGLAAISPRRRQRFFAEMEALGRLDHPNIVHATDAGEWHGCPFLVMELLEGADLNQCVKACGAWPIGAACAAVQQAARGLQYAHEKNLVHRDIKPSNLFLTRDGAIKILDLGLVRIQDPANADELTGSHEVMGTYDYMAPEQGASSRHVDIRADLYSLGCTLFFLLAGRAPFAHLQLATWQEKVQAHTHTPPPALSSLRPETPPELEAILGRLLAKKPEERFAVPNHLVQALGSLANPTALREQMRLSPATQNADAAVRTDSFAGAESPTGPQGSPQTSPQTSQQVGLQTSDTPVAPPRPSIRSRRALRVAALIGAGGVLGVLAVWLAGKLPTKTGPEDPPHQWPAVPAIDAVGVWRELLAGEPKVLGKPITAPRLVHDAAKRELWLDTGEFCMIGLGETKARDYEFELGFHQNLDTLGTGIFLAAQGDAEAAEGLRLLVFQARQAPLAGGGLETIVEGLPMHLVFVPKRFAEAHTAARGSLGPKLPNSFSFAATVRAGKLRDLQVNGRSFAPWSQMKRVTEFEPYAGAFGLSCQRGSISVSYARYRPLAPEE
ncbi:MAG: protein kinase [Gemmataceae bacterium]|nr:protein kinase [Gemmataceae bacterium]